MNRTAWLIVGLFAFANVGALIFAFLRFRATRDLPPTLPQAVEPSLDGESVTPSARLRDLESQFKSIERAFNDLHTTVETRHRSLSGLISKKFGRPAAPVEDDDDEPISPPKSAFQKLAELSQQQEPPPPAPNSTHRRHLRRY